MESTRSATRPRWSASARTSATPRTTSRPTASAPHGCSRPCREAASPGPLVLASSMVVYGEGGYDCAEHGTGGVRCPAAVRTSTPAGSNRSARLPGALSAALGPRADAGRSTQRLRGEQASSGTPLRSVRPREREGVRYTALRYHNVYGPRMPRDTPYAGVASIFRSSLESGRSPAVFEDGRQIRDFVHVRDVARANLLALDARPEPDRRLQRRQRPAAPAARHGTPAFRGRRTESAPAPVVTGQFRLGDVRHVFADATRARERTRLRGRSRSRRRNARVRHRRASVIHHIV